MKGDVARNRRGVKGNGGDGRAVICALRVHGDRSIF